MYMMTYIPPKHWWRRKHSISLTIWPDWLARLLCSHDEKHPIAWNEDGSVAHSQCSDCYAWIPKVRVPRAERELEKEKEKRS